MICPPCEDAGQAKVDGDSPETVREMHLLCANLFREDGRRRDLVATTWCDCQHSLAVVARSAV